MRRVTAVRTAPRRPHQFDDLDKVVGGIVVCIVIGSILVGRVTAGSLVCTVVGG